MQQRYYDPVIGRFYSNDPLGFRDINSFNRYVYANNNPYKYVDPSGRVSEPKPNRFCSGPGGCDYSYTAGKSTNIGKKHDKKQEHASTKERDTGWWAQIKAFVNGAVSYPSDVVRTAVTGGSVVCEAFLEACTQNVENSRRIGSALHEYNNNPEVAKQVDIANKVATQVVMNDPVVQSQIAGRATVATVVGTGGIIGMGFNVMALTGGALRTAETVGPSVNTSELMQGALKGGGNDKK